MEKDDRTRKHPDGLADQSGATSPHPLAGATLELIDTVLSGNAWKVRLACGYMGLHLRCRSLNILKGDLQTEAFGHINPFRQVPVLRTREGTWLAESAAILWYLGAGSGWLPEGRLAQSEVLRWLSFEQTLHMENFAQPRLLVSLRKTATVDDPRVIAWREKGMKAAAIMDAELAQQAFIAADTPTIADIALYPYTRMAAQGGYELCAFRHVTAWLDRMEALPGFTSLIPESVIAPDVSEGKQNA